MLGAEDYHSAEERNEGDGYAEEDDADGVPVVEEGDALVTCIEDWG